MDVLKVKDLSYSYDKKKILDSISFSIKEKTINAVLSSNNGGKTTLIKTLSGILPCDSGNISVNKTKLGKNNYAKYSLNISTILDDIDEQFICETVQDEVEYPLINLKYKPKKIKKITDNVMSLLKIDNIANIKTDYLRKYEKVRVLLAASIVSCPKVLFIDDSLRFLTEKEKEEILDMFKSICSEFGITILFTTSNLNDLKDIDNIIVLNDGKIIMEDSFDNIILNDNELSKIGIEIPMMIDLSRKLQFYNLLDKIYYDKDEVVDKLWN